MTDGARQCSSAAPVARPTAEMVTRPVTTRLLRAWCRKPADGHVWDLIGAGDVATFTGSPTGLRWRQRVDPGVLGVLNDGARGGTIAVTSRSPSHEPE